MYADIGPSSLARQQVPLLPRDFDLDDNVVEYAKLNHALTSAGTATESQVDSNIVCRLLCAQAKL